MSDFLSIMRAVSINAGVEPVDLIRSDDPDQVLLAQFVNEAGVEVARRADWRGLRGSQEIVGTGAAGPYSLNADFDRLTPGLSIACGWAPVRGSLTPDEWSSCMPVLGVPRYFYLYAGNVEFYPYPRTTDTLKVSYQSKNWVSGDKAIMSMGGDAPLVPAELLEAGAIWRWRRHVGKDYADQLAEFEAKLSDLAQKDAGVRQP